MGKSIGMQGECVGENCHPPTLSIHAQCSKSLHTLTAKSWKLDNGGQEQSAAETMYDVEKCRRKNVAKNVERAKMLKDVESCRKLTKNVERC